MASFSGGVPMVKIDGGAIRSLREERGLTQLYLATSVEVTTDTISRWENKRYPQIKKENAIKLAEALDVELDMILDHHDDEAPSPESEDILVETPNGRASDEKTASESLNVYSSFISSPSGRVALLFGVVALLLVIVVLFWQNLYQSKATISAERIVPAHVFPGRPFPVSITIDTGADTSSFILKEIVPANCTVVQGSASDFVVDKNSREIKWITKAKTPVVRVGYMLLSKDSFTVGDKIVFSGTVTQRRSKGRGRSVRGRSETMASFFHWADSNMDGTLDDDEVLAVYDDYDEIEGVSLNMEEIEDIWFGSGYSWNKEKREFVVEN